MKKSPLYIAASLLLVACGGQKAEAPLGAVVTVTNPLALDRTDELVQLDLAEALAKAGLTTADSLVVLDAAGRQVPYQTAFRGRMLVFPATVAAGGTSQYFLAQGTPEEFEPVVAGRQYPERVDDFAWENEYSAYRCYGPALQASGERAYGFDVWVKNTRELVVEDRYVTEESAKPEIARLRKEGKTAEADALEHETSYHYDHGKGLDCYKVGATLGGGTPGLYRNEQIIYPYCYTDYEVLEEGPLRMAVRFDYEQKTLDGKPYTEHRIISFEKGSRMNTCIVFYEGLQDGSVEGVQVAAGLVVHSENTDYVLNPERGYVAYADPTDPSQGGVEANGSIFVGIVAPQMDAACYQAWTGSENPADMKARGGAEGHVMALLPLPTAGEGQRPAPAVYFFGSSWSKGDMPTMEAWTQYLDEFAQKIDAPLLVTL